MTVTEPAPVQVCLDDAGPPIVDTPFCVVDVETTGESTDVGAITEIAAVRIRGGVCEGTWSTLVDPGRSIPARITALTGICAATVAAAPPFRDVVDELTDFVGDAVLVGHNVRYDSGFLAAEFTRAGRKPLANRTVCTLALARRLLRDEVPNCALGTLADQLRLDHRPSHRALDDVLATIDLFWLLLERAATWGILGLEDLFLLPRLTGHPQAAKLRLTRDLPREPGVYLFRDRNGSVIYVGKATNLRARVRSYFGSDDRRKVARLLRETATIDHEVCVHPLAAAVREVELIDHYLPHYNSRSTRWRSTAYLRLTDELFPRFSVGRTPPPEGSVHLGPLVSTSTARRVADAVTTVVPLRRCNRRSPASATTAGQLAFTDVDVATARSASSTPCTPAQLGVACCPCSGATSAADYAAYVDDVRQGFVDRPDLLLGPLRERLEQLSRQRRFEEAADVRDRAATLAAALRRHRRLHLWRRARRVVVVHSDGSGAEILHGLLGRTWSAGQRPEDAAVRSRAGCPPAEGAPIAREELYERLCIVTEIERAGSPWHLEHVDGVLAEPATRIDDFQPRGQHAARPGR